MVVERFIMMMEGQHYNRFPAIIHGTVLVGQEAPGFRGPKPELLRPGVVTMTWLLLW